MYFCTVHGNSRVMICALNSAHWQQGSKLSAVRRFELIRIDLDKCAYQYDDNNDNNHDNNVKRYSLFTTKHKHDHFFQHQDEKRTISAPNSVSGIGTNHKTNTLRRNSSSTEVGLT